MQNVSSELTFEINPEIDFEYSGRIVKLEKEIEKFIETEVKFDILSKRLQRLITKLNILHRLMKCHYAAMRQSQHLRYYIIYICLQKKNI